MQYTDKGIYSLRNPSIGKEDRGSSYHLDSAKRVEQSARPTGQSGRNLKSKETKTDIIPENIQTKKGPRNEGLFLYW